MAERKFSELTTASVLTDDDIFALSQEDNQVLMSKKTTLLAIATRIAMAINFTNALNTTDKTLIGAINEIKALAELIPQFSIVVVETLPVSDISETTIYLVPSSDPQTQNAYDEFIYTDDAWEQVGSTAIDLSNYYTKTETNSLLNNKADSSELDSYYTKTESNALLNNKLDIDGTAEKTKSVVVAAPYNDTAPYIYRQTPVKESFKALMKKIIGASVVWNQLWNETKIRTDTSNGLSYSANSDHSLTINGILSSSWSNIYTSANLYIELKPSNVYMLLCDTTNLPNGNFMVRCQTSGGTNSGAVSANRVVKTNANVEKGVFRIEATSQTEFDNIKIGKPIFVDLTAMFGTTIADYVYTLETSQSGSGIAWLQSYGFFTEDYYAYKQNKLESGCVSAKKIVGKNLFNKANFKFAVGYIDGNGWQGNKTILDYPSDSLGNFWNSIILDISKLRNKSVTYSYFNTQAGTYRGILDSDFNVLARIGNSAQNVGTVDLSQYPTAKYLALTFIKSEYNFDNAQIEIGLTATSYEPYTETTYPISPITLRGLFKLSTDKLTVDGDEYNADGSVTRKYGESDLGNDLEWSFYNQSSYPTFYRADISDKADGKVEMLLTANYTYTTTWATARDNSGYYFLDNAEGRTKRIYINDSNYATVQAFTNALKGQKVIYPLATPTTEQTTPFTETEIVGSTEEFIDYEVVQGNRDVAIPVGTDTDYYQEMKVPSLPTASGDYALSFNPSLGFSWLTINSNNRALLRIEPNTIEEVNEPLEESSESEER